MALFPQVRCTVMNGRERRLSEEWRLWVGIGGVVTEVFMSEEDFELTPLWDREPVAILEDRADVVTGTAVGEQMSSRVTEVYLLWMMCHKDVINAWNRVSAVEKDGGRRIQAVFLKWKNAVFVIIDISKERSLPRITPRLWISC